MKQITEQSNLKIDGGAKAETFGWRPCINQCGRYVLGSQRVCYECKQKETGFLSWCVEENVNMFALESRFEYIRHLEDIVLLQAKRVYLGLAGRRTVKLVISRFEEG